MQPLRTTDPVLVTSLSLLSVLMTHVHATSVPSQQSAWPDTPGGLSFLHKKKLQRLLLKVFAPLSLFNSPFLPPSLPPLSFVVHCSSFAPVIKPLNLPCDRYCDQCCSRCPWVAPPNSNTEDVLFIVWGFHTCIKMCFDEIHPALPTIRLLPYHTSFYL